MDFAHTNKPPFIAHQIILKVASRCNLACDYCHWFRDPTVYAQPKLMSVAVEDAFLHRLERYLAESAVAEMVVVFHGGEPMLLPQARYRALTEKVRGVERRVSKPVKLLMTTNGALIDDAWASLLHSLGISPCVSLDGTKEVHDAHRVDLRGRGTHDRVVQGLLTLRKAGFDPSVLTVCNPDSSPDELFAFLVDELGVTRFDVLQPNFTRDDRRNGLVKSIADYYIRLFDLWYDTYSRRGVDVRIASSLVKVVIGRHSGVQGLGLDSHLAHVVIQPDGTIEPHDVLRIGGNHLVHTGCNVRTHDLTDVTSDPAWLAAFDASQTPAAECLACPHHYACGGGEVMHRYSSERGYDNPSVYCDDLKRVIEHVWSRVSADLFESDLEDAEASSPVLSGAH